MQQATLPPAPAPALDPTVEPAPDAAEPAHPSLSPSRASDFMTCPLLYRFRVIDKLPEAPSRDAVRGTVVHSVLERLFDLPALDRTPQRASELLGPAWDELRASEPGLAEMFAAGEGEEPASAASDAALGAWLEECRTLLGRYFTLEDPRRLEPAEREVYVETLLESGLQLRGYIDRVDVAPTGEVRIVDYKTGRAPGEHFEAKALFQMKFYALVLWRTRGVVPRMLQLVYLGSGEMLRYVPEERDLLATERKVQALWAAIKRATETGEWRPSKSALCGWCDHRALCPAWGGTPPPLPAHDLAAAVEHEVPRTGVHDPEA
jgi:putative RecB family exonuclease